MLYVCTVYDSPPPAAKFQITRAKPVAGWTFFPSLAPSSELFHRYLEWRRRGLWPKMWPEYERQFRKEMTSREFQSGLTEVVETLYMKKDAAISCFCQNVNYRHRRIVADEIRRRTGCEVRFL